MKNYIIGTEYDCLKILKDGPLSTEITNDKGNKSTKKENDYSLTDFRIMEENAKAMSLLQQGITNYEVNWILACSTGNEIWDTLKLAYEGISEVRRSKIDLLMTKYESFNMPTDENIRDMFTHFMTIINEWNLLEKVLLTRILLENYWEVSQENGYPR